MKPLYAGPWVGEFGWELFAWQGHLRWLSDNGREVHVICEPGHEFLYKDFAKSVDTRRSPIRRKDGPFNRGFDPAYPYPSGVDILRPRPFDTLPKDQFRYIRYIHRSPVPRFVAVHARARTKDYDEARVWPIDKWNKLCEVIQKQTPIAAIGTKEGAELPYGCHDFRSNQLDRTIPILGLSSLIIGPSSGPMHLATLCDCPQVVWSGHRPNQVRYETDWNPFNVKVCYLNSHTWNPEVHEVLSCTNSLLSPVS